MTHINQRRDIAANWASSNPVLELGEVGWETDTLQAKLGDGVTAWNLLDYALVSVADLAPLASPAFTGNPTAPTPALADDDTSIATTAWVRDVAAPIDSPVFTGDPKAPTPATGDNDMSVATTAFVKNQNYADAAKIANILLPVRALATGAVTLSGVGQVIDGVTTQAGDRVLLWGNTTNNGIWVVNTGAWTRPADVDTLAEIPRGAMIWVNEGTVSGQRYWVQMKAAPADFSQLIWQVPNYTQAVPTAFLPSSPNNGHTLFDTNRNAMVVWGGAGWLTTAIPVATTWNPATTYFADTVVSYGGMYWKSKSQTTNQCPALSTSVWTLLGGDNGDKWVERDPYFNGDLYTDSWEPFWKVGAPVTSRTTTAGEFETGVAALKSVMVAGENQRIYNKDETIVRDGETIVMTIRAKLSAASAGSYIAGALITNDVLNAPVPLATGAVTTPAAEGNQVLTTSWATYTFTFTVPVGTKPRANVSFIMTAPTNAATFLIDRVRIVKATKTDDSGWITVGSGGTAPAYKTNFADANSGADYKCRFRRVGGYVTVVMAFAKSGATAPVFDLPAGFWPSVNTFGALTNTTAAYTAGSGFQVTPAGAVVLSSGAAANGSYFGSVTYPI